MQVSTPGAPARGRARNNTRLHALAESCTRCLFRAKRPFAQWCVSPECKFGPDRDRRLDTGGAAQSATPYGRLKFSPRSRPNYLRKVTSEGRCSMERGHLARDGPKAPRLPRGQDARAPRRPAVPERPCSRPELRAQSAECEHALAEGAIRHRGARCDGCQMTDAGPAFSSGAARPGPRAQRPRRRACRIRRLRWRAWRGVSGLRLPA